MTNTPDHAPNDASAVPQPAGGELSVQPPTTVGAVPDPDEDALRVLLQASAAAEALQSRFAELQRQKSLLDADRAQLSADRTAFESRASQFAQQVALDRTAQREISAELDRRQHDMSQLESDLEQQQEILEEGRAELDAKRQRLADVVNDELARERQILARQRGAVDEERERLLQRAEDQQLQHDERMQKIEHDLHSEREAMRETIRREMAAELEQLNRERIEWEAMRDSQAAELQEQSEDLQQQRELFGEQLEAEQQRLREEVEKRRQALLTEQNNLQRRYRFQFEHLSRARDDFEEELRELRREQQLFRSERTRFQELHRLRFGQLEHLHAVLMDREQSLKREQKVVERERLSVESDLKRQADRLDEHRTSVLQDLESRSRQLRQAEQASAETASRIEQRSQHINALRVELDLQQRDILEQRLLLEELLFQPHIKQLPVEGTSSYALARKAVEQFFEQLHSPLQLERDRLQEQAELVDSRREEFQRDRAELEMWFADKERELLAKSSGVRTRDEENVLELEEELARVRHRWNVERREAEATIRSLLDQVAQHAKKEIRLPVMFDEQDRAAA
ncbi:MAG: hypothetical protein NXI04_05130 [Planctomycetaceae bacterium]|nr:hypothetical protein [Planctomycetaceae bacterium]